MAFFVFLGVNGFADSETLAFFYAAFYAAQDLVNNVYFSDLLIPLELSLSFMIVDLSKFVIIL